jgi:hypothetical protein
MGRVGVLHAGPCYGFGTFQQRITFGLYLLLPSSCRRYGMNKAPVGWRPENRHTWAREPYLRFVS